MAATVVYVGGPCDGKRTTVTWRGFTGEVTKCGGALYDLTVVSSTLYRAEWQGGTAGAGGATVAAGSEQFDKAWHGLMHVLAYKVPAANERIRAARGRLRKAVK